MQLNKILFSAALLLTGVAIFFTSCEREYELKYEEIYGFENRAMVKFFNGALGTVRNNVYIDDVPMSGRAGIVAFNATFPATVAGFAVEPGSRSVLIKDTSLTATQPQITFTHNFEAGKNYTIFTYDTLATVKHKIVETPIVIPTDTTARIRFANFVYSPNAVPNIDIYSVKKGANIFTNVPVTGVTDYIAYQTDVIDTLYARATGTLTNLTPVFTITPREKRHYTVVFRGRYGLAGASTVALARLLSVVTDY